LHDRLPRQEDWDESECLLNHDAYLLIHLMKELKSEEFINGVFKNGGFGLYGSWERAHFSEDRMFACFIDYFFQYSYSDPDEEYSSLKYPVFRNNYIDKEPKKTLDLIIDNFEYKHIFMPTIFQNYEDDDFFKIGKVLGDRLREDESDKLADIAMFLINETGSKSFADGVLSEGDIESMTRHGCTKATLMYETFEKLFSDYESDHIKQDDTDDSLDNIRG
jgi:hypothetical protein